MTTHEPGAHAALGLLLDEHPAPLSLREIALELAEHGELTVGDTLAYLARLGLAYRSGELWWATRAAVVGRQLAL